MSWVRLPQCWCLIYRDNFVVWCKWKQAQWKLTPWTSLPVLYRNINFPFFFARLTSKQTLTRELYSWCILSGPCRHKCTNKRKRWTPLQKDPKASLFSLARESQYSNHFHTHNYLLSYQELTFFCFYCFKWKWFCLSPQVFTVLKI